eukprot:CAMPEP_0206145580 /NCGR_PEP_ID=MMETSP1473-20131121/27823_1 /ASSEMBLY_ACC=CAM_ASM_001109 /TAXON_ID=1461547 /ORGANISM="Stichococcus sp, Strain RCC1054" /LENGTH=221 /DNA_ID=CAMNT_0053541845 /DNA_START=122 /DNA_END=783 /DNA_ORIENTATION=+
MSSAFEFVPMSRGAEEQRGETPLKRSRSQAMQVAQRISGDLARTSMDLTDALEMDNVRSQKRYLSESIAAEINRMSCGGATCSGPGSSAACCQPDDSTPGSPMATERRMSNGSVGGSPQASEQFNPFASAKPRDFRSIVGESSGNGTPGFQAGNSLAGASGNSPEVAPQVPANPTSPVTPQRSIATAIDKALGFASPTPSRMRLTRGEGCGGTMDASEAER